MKLQELVSLNEGEVVKGDFSRGRSVDNPDVQIPKGYDRFEVDGKKVIGIKGDKRVVVSSTSDERLAKALVSTYNGGGKGSESIKPISMMQAFGSRSENKLHDAGIKLTEKPSYWEDFDGNGWAAKNNLNDLTVKKAEKLLGKIPRFTGEQVFGLKYKPRGPLASTKMDPKDVGEIAIITFEDGTKYMVSPQGASTYIRNWQKIN